MSDSGTDTPGVAGPEVVGEGGWLRRSRRQVELYTIGSLDGMYVIFALICLLDVWARSAAWGVAEALASVLLGGLTVSAIAFNHRCLGARRPRRGELVAVFALSVGSSAAMIATKRPDWLYSEGAGVYFATFLPLMIGFAALSLRVPGRRLAPSCLLAGAVVTGAFAILGIDPIGLGLLAVYGVLIAVAGVVTGGFSYWLLDVVRRLDEARETNARLAVAEERLRFSRDLHDVYGRTLSAIAMKSELAAELSTRGDERAADQMREVHDLAQSSLSEVRGIVAGYRQASLETEVAGAAAMLRAAGARLEVTGLEQAQAALGPQGRVVLAWVVREAVTNVIRHSRATLVRLSARVPGDVEGMIVVSIDNDGLRSLETEESARAPVGRSGNGLRGLRERAEAVGGTVETRADDGLFTLQVVLPVGA